MNDFNDIEDLHQDYAKRTAISSNVINGQYISLMFGFLASGFLITSASFIQNIIPYLVLFIYLVPTISSLVCCHLFRRYLVRTGANVVKPVMLSNVFLLCVMVFFSDITSLFAWIIWIIAFVPVFLITYFFFRKLERNAIETTDSNGKVVGFETTKLASRVNDDNFREYLIQLGLGDLNYFYARGLNKKIDKSSAQATSFHIIAFNDEQLYNFEMLGFRKINHLEIASVEMVVEAQMAEFENKKRLQLGGMSLEIRYDEKGFSHQREMLERFVNLLKNEC